MALNANNGGSDGVRRINPPPAPKVNTTGPQNSEYSQMPVLVMTLAFSRFICATMIPSRMAGDILAGMWLLLGQLGGVTHRLLWDRESAIATSAGKPTVDAAAFAGTLSSKLVIAPPRDPEFKGMVERHNVRDAFRKAGF